VKRENLVAERREGYCGLHGWPWNFMKLLELVRRLLRVNTQRFSYSTARLPGWLWYKTEQKQKESRVGMRQMWSFWRCIF
jgi:hypothetical protein